MIFSTGGLFYEEGFLTPMNMQRWLSLMMLILFVSCTRKPEPFSVQPPEALTHEQWVIREAQSLARSLSLRQRAAQVLMTGIDGKSTFPRHLWDHFNGDVPGAILLFGYNIADTPDQVHAYVSSCTNAFETMGGIVKPFFAIDHEGGTVFRLGGITSPLPSARKTAELLSPEQAESLYELTGVQLRLLGLTMNLAPVAEIRTPSNEPFLSRRSFGPDVDLVTAYAAAAMRGYLRTGVVPVLKHYPGNTNSDPHTGTSVLSVSPEEFYSQYRYPFKILFAEGAPAVLLSHIEVRQLDPDIPFCLSQKGVSGVLRTEDSFSGLAITDDISMGALVEGGRTSAENAVNAIRSGCDMVMTSETDIQAIVTALEREAAHNRGFDKRLEDAVVSIIRTKLDAGVTQSSRQRYAWSQLGRTSSMIQEPFDAGLFTEARQRATAILENAYGNN